MFGYRHLREFEREFWRGLREEDYTLAESALDLVREIAQSENRPEQSSIVKEQLKTMEGVWDTITKPYQGIGEENAIHRRDKV